MVEIIFNRSTLKMNYSDGILSLTPALLKDIELFNCLINSLKPSIIAHFLFLLDLNNFREYNLFIFYIKNN